MKCCGGLGSAPHSRERPGAAYNPLMRIASITAGAAGMYCGSCMRDNTLAAALIQLGHDTLLLPTYTPIRTDEANVSGRRVFFGGISVFLEQQGRLFQRMPRFLRRILDSRLLLKAASLFAVSVRAEKLGPLTVSMLQGAAGNQRKELEELVRWLEKQWRPDVILLTNVLLSGMAPELKRRLRVPIVATLQGDDIYLDMLPPADRSTCVDLIRANCEYVDGFIATCGYYADYMAQYLDLPRELIQVVYPGINLAGFDASAPPRKDQTPVIGYFGRIAPEKGLAALVDAFIELKKHAATASCRLRYAGWLGSHHKRYHEAIRKKLDDAGLATEAEHVHAPSHADKVRFLKSIDVFSVPAPYREPKGLYVLEALAAGVPVVQPAHGSFPELVDATGGGVLVPPDDTAALAEGLRLLITDPKLRRELGENGRRGVREQFTAAAMAQATAQVLAGFTG